MATRRTPSRFALLTLGVAAGATLVWTLLMIFGVLEPLDRATQPAGLVPGGAAAQIWSAFALVTWPGLPYLALLIIAAWAYSRRLRNLALALVLSVVVGWGGVALLKLLLQVPRPDSPLHVITSSGSSYPSSHLTAATVLGIMVASTTTVTRQGPLLRRWSRVGAIALVVLVGADRLVMNAHWLSDLVGGLLWGTTAAAIALIIADVKVLPDNILEPAASPAEIAPDEPKPRAAIIYNPVKVGDMATFRRHVEYELGAHGYDRPIWLETSADDPGHQMAQVAIRKKVDLVLGAGGDGTVRVICEELAGTGIPFGLIPAGTGNLLARNLGIPLDEAQALRVALEGENRQVDLIKLSVDNGEHTHTFAVMAGIGIDAAIMENTDANLKKAVGSAAYFVSAAQQANHPPLPVTITLDDGEPFRRKASVVLIGNVSSVTGGIELLSGASAEDGKLDLLVASPRTPQDWVRVASRVLTRQKGSEPGLDRLSGRKVSIVAERSDSYQLDGDTEGTGSRLDAEVLPGALTLRMG